MSRFLKQHRRLIARMAVVIALGALALAQPALVRTLLRSPRALALIVVVTALTSLGGRFVQRWGGWATLSLRMTVGGAVFLVLVLPALRQKTLDEALPVDAAAATTAGESRPSSTAGSPRSNGSTAPTENAGPLTIGALEGIGHHATGAVEVYRSANGSAFVRFVDVDIRNAPDPVLYIVPRDAAETREGGVEIGPLRATKGTFNQVLPPNIGLDQPFTVFIWCERYATPIAAAAQRPS